MDMVWYWTYDKTEVMAIKILRQALDMLKKDPRYTFTQDQMKALKPFWDSLSDADRQFLRRMVQEGRFEVTTGMNTQPDVAASDYESLTRQFFPALPWMEETFGTKVSDGMEYRHLRPHHSNASAFRERGLALLCLYARRPSRRCKSPSRAPSIGNRRMEASY